MNDLKHYVLGFMFDSAGEFVVLVTKNRPDFMAGKLNGVGGKIEEYDADEYHAMAREYREEAGIMTYPGEWRLFARLYGEGFCVHCFTCFNTEHLQNSRTMEDEEINIYNSHDPFSTIHFTQHDRMVHTEFLVSMAKIPDHMFDVIEREE